MSSDFKKYLSAFEFNTKLPGSGETVRFRPIKTKQMKRLLMFENQNDPQVIEAALDEIINECVIDEEFDIKKLYLQDRFFLLLEIRKKTKGETHKFEYSCDSCNSQSMQNIPLNDLEIRTLYDKKIDDKNFNKVQLNDNIAVRIEHIKREFQINATKVVESLAKKKNLTDNQKMAEMTMISYALAIKSVITEQGEDTKVSDADKIYIINEITQSEYEKIMDWYKENDFGVIFEYDVVCPHCKSANHIDIPLDNFFF